MKDIYHGYVCIKLICETAMSAGSIKFYHVLFFVLFSNGCIVSAFTAFSNRCGQSRSLNELNARQPKNFTIASICVEIMTSGKKGRNLNEAQNREHERASRLIIIRLRHPRFMIIRTTRQLVLNKSFCFGYW